MKHPASFSLGLFLALPIPTSPFGALRHKMTNDTKSRLCAWALSKLGRSEIIPAAVKEIPGRTEGSAAPANQPGVTHNGRSGVCGEAEEAPCLSIC
jgi:hypothetical protein